MRTRIAPFTITAVMLAGGLAAAASPAGAAEPTANAAPAGCYNTARYYTSAPGSGSRNAHWPGTGIWAYTTRNCVDINVKVNATRRVRTCFKATRRCNGWRTARAGRWQEAATNVRDRSGFYIQFKGTARSTGWIAY